AAERALPQSIADDDDRAFARLEIGGVESPSAKRGDSKCAEQVLGDAHPLDLLGNFAAGERDAPGIDGAHRLERSRGLADVGEIVVAERIRMRLKNRNQARGVAVRQ